MDPLSKPSSPIPSHQRIDFSFSESSSSNSMGSLPIGSPIALPTTDPDAYASDSKNAQCVMPSTHNTSPVAPIRTQYNPQKLEFDIKEICSELNLFIASSKEYVANIDQTISQIQNYKKAKEAEEAKKAGEAEKAEEAEEAKKAGEAGEAGEAEKSDRIPNPEDTFKELLTTLSSIFIHTKKPDQISNEGLHDLKNTESEEISSNSGQDDSSVAEDKIEVTQTFPNEQNTLKELLVTLSNVFNYSEKTSQEWQTSPLKNIGTPTGRIFAAAFEILEADFKNGGSFKYVAHGDEEIYAANNSHYYTGHFQPIWNNRDLNSQTSSFDYFGKIQYEDNPDDKNLISFAEGEYFFVNENTRIKSELYSTEKEDIYSIAKKTFYFRNDSDTSLTRNIKRAQRLYADIWENLKECETFISDIEQIIASKKALMQYFVAGIIFTAASASLLFAFINTPVVIPIAVYASINLIINALLLYKFQNIWKSYSEIHTFQSHLDVFKSDLKIASKINIQMQFMIRLSNDIRHTIDYSKQDPIKHEKCTIDAKGEMTPIEVKTPQETIDIHFIKLKKIVQELKKLFPHTAALQNDTGGTTSPIHMV